MYLAHWKMLIVRLLNNRDVMSELRNAWLYFLTILAIHAYEYFVSSQQRSFESLFNFYKAINSLHVDKEAYHSCYPQSQPAQYGIHQTASLEGTQTSLHFQDLDPCRISVVSWDYTESGSWSWLISHTNQQEKLTWIFRSLMVSVRLTIYSFWSEIDLRLDLLFDVDAAAVAESFGSTVIEISGIERSLVSLESEWLSKRVTVSHDIPCKRWAGCSKRTWTLLQSCTCTYQRPAFWSK